MTTETEIAMQLMRAQVKVDKAEKLAEDYRELLIIATDILETVQMTGEYDSIFAVGMFGDKLYNTVNRIKYPNNPVITNDTETIQETEETT